MKADEENLQFALALPSHLSAVLGLPQEHPMIKRYVSSLTSEGWDSPDDFDELTVDVLRRKPFLFKSGHLVKVRDSRHSITTNHQHISAVRSHATDNIQVVPQNIFDKKYAS